MQQASSSSGALEKLICQHNKNEQQAAVGSHGPQKTAQGGEVLETTNIYTVSSAFKMQTTMKIVACGSEKIKKNEQNSGNIFRCIGFYYLGQGK